MCHVTLNSTCALLSMIRQWLGSIYDVGLSAVACCLPLQTVRVNGRTFRIVRTIAEGGFSTVLLAQDPRSGRLFAVKRIYCGAGDEETLRRALKEAELHRKFDGHPLVAKLLDVCVEQNADGSRIAYLFFPYYRVLFYSFIYIQCVEWNCARHHR